MKRNTKKNREKLAEEAVSQLDMDSLLEYAAEQLESYYETISTEDFTSEWNQVFGED